MDEVFVRGTFEGVAHEWNIYKNLLVILSAIDRIMILYVCFLILSISIAFQVQRLSK